ncbi:AraC family transcriptional regulator [Streptomyces sp. NPDC006372]|uniref:helix-turn-helix domain-containing protein n=1 Tax=Streptomyces sp. NPDC006372 TaxID=3155599 RepID=UPI0033AFA016
MDRNGQARITEVPFRPSPGGPPGAEVWDFARLRERAAQDGVDLLKPMRAEFHHLISVKRGFLRHWVDGVEHLMPPGAWLWIRPDQVHRFDTSVETAQGAVVFFMPGFVAPGTVAAAYVGPFHPQGTLVPDAEERASLDATLSLLETTYDSVGALPVEAYIELIRHLVSALVLRLAHLHDDTRTTPVGNDVFRRYAAAVDRDLATTRRVDDYARALGYSVRTLTRACRAATGRSAKQYLDDRTVLEAKRLLVHTGLSAAAVGERLGFSSPTVFTKFFRTRAGETPAAFASRARGGRHGE